MAKARALRHHSVICPVCLITWWITDEADGMATGDPEDEIRRSDGGWPERNLTLNWTRTDQGCKFTSEAFTFVLKIWNVMSSMDGKGRFLGNIIIKRLNSGPIKPPLPPDDAYCLVLCIYPLHKVKWLKG